jgi:hypothetical protein
VGVSLVRVRKYPSFKVKYGSKNEKLSRIHSSPQRPSGIYKRNLRRQFPPCPRHANPILFSTPPRVPPNAPTSLRFRMKLTLRPRRANYANVVVRLRRLVIQRRKVEPIRALNTRLEGRNKKSLSTKYIENESNLRIAPITYIKSHSPDNNGRYRSIITS